MLNTGDGSDRKLKTKVLMKKIYPFREENEMKSEMSNDN